MPRKLVKLFRIDEEGKNTEETDAEFLYFLKQGLLLALKEQGKLTEMQCSKALDSLRCQNNRRP